MLVLKTSILYLILVTVKKLKRGDFIKYDENTIYIVGESRTTKENAITKNYNTFFVGYVIDIKSNKVIDLSCSSILRTTEQFLISIFVGKSFKSYSIELENEIKKRYHGSSQKAIITAYKDAVKKYLEVIKK